MDELYSPITDGLVFSMQGGTTFDSAKNNVITNSGATATTDHNGRAGRGWSLVSAESDYLQITDNTLFRNQTKFSFSCGFRKKVASETIRPLVVYIGTSDTNFIYNTGTLYGFAIGTTGQLAFFNIAQDTNPHFMTWVYDGAGATNAAKVKFYLDGVARTLSFSGTIPTALADANSNLYIGRLSTIYENSEYDMIKIYHTNLQPNQAIYDYNWWLSH